MKHVTSATSIFAISLFLAAPALAQGSYPAGGGERVDANGMPTTHSTPAEQAQTRSLNAGVGQANAAADAQAAQANAQYQYTLQADELQDLRTWEPRVRNALSNLPELTDVNTDQQDRGQQTSLVIDREAASRVGLTVSAIDANLNNAFGQRQVGVIYNPLNQYRVVMELAPPYLQGPETLGRLYFTGASGGQVPLASFATVETTNTPLSINHQSGSPASTISFNLPEGVSLSQATDAIHNAMAELGVPVSVRGSFSGTAGAFQDALAGQPLLILAAIITIYLVLGMLYES